MKKKSENNEEYLTQAPKKELMTVETGEQFPNLKNIPGDSVNEHANLEIANTMIGAKELGQQNENL